MENVYTTVGDEWSPSNKRKMLAWSAHLFTASGAVWGLLAILAIASDQWTWAFVWMASALFVDAFDGLLARRVQVKEVLPNFDGALLDNMIDFLNYVFVPAFFLYEADFMPRPLAMGGAVLILLASSYQFCQNDAKTDDHFFTGFPSYWNVMIFYMSLLSMSNWMNFAAIVFMTIMVFVPIRYIYPSRTTALQKLTMALAIVWGIINIIILTQYPEPTPWLIWASLGYVVYYYGLSLYLMWQHNRMTG